MRIVVGNPVEGDDFFGRQKEQQQLWRKLKTANLLMLAPRRIGKTSLLKRLRDTGVQHQTKVLYCSFAGCENELSCINELLNSLSPFQELHQNVFKQIGHALKQVKGINVAGLKLELGEVEQQQWTRIGQSLTESLEKLKLDEEQLVICVDELPIFILRVLKQPDGLTKVRFFLNWFRQLRQTHSDAIKWVLAGSIGLDTVTNRLGIGDTINDLQPYPLGGFDDHNAKLLLQELAKENELQLDEQVCDYIIGRIGWSVPYYLQVMLDTILDTKIDPLTPVEPQDVDEAFETLLKPAYKSYFDYWRQRLTEELGQPEDGYAITLLNHTCRDSKGVSRDTLKQALMDKAGNTAQFDELFTYLLDTLENDGYIVQVNERYRFRLAWLREYWQSRVAV